MGIDQSKSVMQASTPWSKTRHTSKSIIIKPPYNGATEECNPRDVFQDLDSYRYVVSTTTPSYSSLLLASCALFPTLIARVRGPRSRRVVFLDELPAPELEQRGGGGARGGRTRASSITEGSNDNNGSSSSIDHPVPVPLGGGRQRVARRAAAAAARRRRGRRLPSHGGSHGWLSRPLRLGA